MVYLLVPTVHVVGIVKSMALTDIQIRKASLKDKDYKLSDSGGLHLLVKTALIGEKVLSGEDPDELVIAEGGAAATAYARLQFEDISADSRQKIKEALLRYCELDTLAMVMIVEAWREFVHH